jgi:hypothetical protein
MTGGQAHPLDLARANTADGDGCIRFTNMSCESIADACIPAIRLRDRSCLILVDRIISSEYSSRFAYAGCDSLDDVISRANTTDDRIRQPVPAVNPWLTSFPNANPADGQIRQPVPAIYGPWTHLFLRPPRPIVEFDNPSQLCTHLGCPNPKGKTAYDRIRQSIPAQPLPMPSDGLISQEQHRRWSDSVTRQGIHRYRSRL